MADCQTDTDEKEEPYVHKANYASLSSQSGCSLNHDEEEAEEEKHEEEEQEQVEDGRWKNCQNLEKQIII
jgi:hypothetical protein